MVGEKSRHKAKGIEKPKRGRNNKVKTANCSQFVVPNKAVGMI